MVATVELSVDIDGISLAGSLHVPDGDGPYPAMVMIAGSGPADRDCDGYFAPIRDAFLARGIATYAFDKPGCGASTGDWRDHDLGDRAGHAIAAIEMVRRHAVVDAERVGVWGQSQGGWIVQQLASGSVEVACAIANSGPSIGVIEQDRYAFEHTLRSAGFGDADVDEALSFIDAAHRAAFDDRSAADVLAEIVQPMSGRAWYRLGPTVDDAADWEHTKRLVTEGYDPLRALRRVDRPFLAVYGGRDVLVPAWRGASETGAALNEAGAPDATVVVFPSGDHRIRAPESDDFVDGYLDLLGDWTARRLGTRG